MGFFDCVSSWFASNRHTLSYEQQREIQKLLDRMRMETQDNINSATSSTTRRLEDLMNTHSSRLNSNIEDSRHYFTNEMTRLSDELNKVKQQLDEEEKKKKKGKDENLADEYQKMCDMMKLLMEQQKSFMELQKSHNSYAGPPGGFPPHPGYGNWQQPPAPVPGYQNASYQQNYCHPNPANQQGCYGAVCNEPSSPSSTPSAPPLSSAPPNSPGLYPNFQSPASSTGSRSVRGSPKKLVLPDKRDYKRYGIEHEGNDLSNVSKKLTSKSSANLDSQLGCGLILPDSRDYNKMISASIQKKLEDEEFDKMVDNFSQEFRPGSKSNSTRNENEKRIADGVKNFFLKDKDKLNIPKQRVSRTSTSNASVKEWLQSNDNFASDGDSSESDISEVSVRTDMSKFSSVSVTSGKRVFRNKSGNYGKPVSAVGSSSQNANKNKRSEPKMNKAYTHNENYTHQDRYRMMKKERKDSDSGTKDGDSNFSQIKKHSKSTPRGRRPNFAPHPRHSNSTQRDGAIVTSTASSSKLTEIHYPSQQEADEKHLDIFKPLDRELLFLGKNENDEWTHHNPKCLNDIYDLEKKYKVFRIIEMA